MKKMEFTPIYDCEAQKEKDALVASLLQEEVVLEWLNTYKMDKSFVERHCYKFKDYVETKKKCKDCAGLAACMQKQKGYILDLKYDGVISKSVCACQYLYEKMDALAHAKNFLICDMSEEQLQLSFKKINLRNESGSYLKLVNEMRDAILNENKEGFFLCGEPGCGKTYLACCYVNAMAKQGKKCAFVNVSNYMTTLKAKMYDKDAFSKQIDALKKADVVVLDDIGGESVSNWSRDDILLPILNERMEKQKITLFTSNYSLDNLVLYYAANSKLVNDVVGAKRLVERMKSLSLEKVIICTNRRTKR